jgi:hypothetical protein
VIRHGLHHTRAAAIAHSPMVHLVPNAANCHPMARFDHHSTITNRLAAYRCHNNTARRARRSVGYTIPSISQEAYFP